MEFNSQILDNLKNKPQLFKELKWQIIEKSLRSFTTIFISLIIANIFGTEDFGKYSYAIALTNIFIGFSSLGMPNLIVAQISKYRINSQKIISCFLKIRIVTNTLIFLVFLIYMFLNFKIGLLLVLCISTSFLDIFESYNQGNLKLVDNAKSKIIAYCLGLFLKLISIFYFKNYKLVLIIYSLEISLSYFIIYKYSGLKFKKIFFDKVEINLLKSVIRKLIPLSLTSLFIILTSKLDVLVIQSKFGYSLLGQYNIFSQVILIWSIIPLMFTNYHMPRLAKCYSLSVSKYKSEIIKYGKIYFFIGLIISFISLFVFNIQYQILNYNNKEIYIAGTILCFVNIPLCISLLQASIIAINNLHFYGFLKTTLNFILMLFFSLIISDFLGIIGLPIAINLSYIFSEYILPKIIKNNIRYSLNI
ncbi:MAG: hypothetical protein CMD04_05460 [Flavobacteriales bacterium]|nr:hypothetical protein [Flavobacteriales bacterium]